MGWLTRLKEGLFGRRRLRRERPPAGQLGSIEEVCDQLRRIGAGLPTGDGVAAFNTMYLRVTERIAERVADGFFADREFITRLDIVFAHLYLDAVAAARPSSAWAPVFEARRAPGRLPIQFALAGMNAHINHDLPIAVVATCRQLGLGPTSRHVESDYLKVTDVLATVQEEVRQSFLDGLALEIDRAYAAPVANLVSSWSIGRAREVAWVNALVLWQLADAADLRRGFVDALSSSVGLAGRTLLTPVGEFPD